MSKPLTENQLRTLAMTGDGRTDRQYKVAQAALARLEFLERKVQAADRIANEVREGYGVRAGRFVVEYDEVTE